MKRCALLAVSPAMIAAIFLLVSCPIEPDEPETVILAQYQNFHNYPDGRRNASGTLKIRNSVASPVLVFTDSVAPGNYIGTIDSLNDIKVKLPEEKFYTIVAVDKEVWEEKGEQASQFSDFTYYSNTQPYSLTVQASETYGGGTWIINNNTNYWVSFRKADQSGITYAVAAPKAKRVSVPVKIGENYDYIPHYYRELKYNGKVIALVESDVPSEADTVTTSETHRTFNTDIGLSSVPSVNIKPAIFFTNSSDKTVRVYYGTNEQLSNGSTPGEDFALASGISQLFSSGLEAGSNISGINFSSIAWNSRVYVSQDMPMQIDKVYRVLLTGTSGNYSTTVVEQDANEYFE